MPDRVDEELVKARQRLLDLTARNRLLNFRPTKRTSVRIVDELPAEVWRLLVAQEKALSFLAREEHELFQAGPADEEGQPPATDGGISKPANQRGEDRGSAEGADSADAVDQKHANGAMFQLPDLNTALDVGGGHTPARYQDTFLQTALDGANLQTNLLRIEQAARSALEEQGVNFLFLALGFLEWRPVEDASQAYKAPILLVPVKLERTTARKRFKLTALDEEPILNPCLAAKLKRDFHIDLPEPPEAWADFDAEAYYRQVESAVAEQANWRVPRDIVLGLFSFTKYLMYLDLDPQRWPSENALPGQPLIRAMCGDAEGMAKEAFDLPGLPDDTTVDPQDVFQVHDADSSQQTAILAAKTGKSLVIEGPPGTGKSQTITNIIAECLAAGKTVLFVSEKMAALEVVKRRLEQAGLGDFCLELHSTKANRRAILEQLERAWNRKQVTFETAEDAQHLARLRGRLTAYVRALHEPFGPGQLTPYYAMGRAAILSNVSDVLCEIPGHETWDRKQFQDVRELAERLSRQWARVHPVGEHSWRGARLNRCTGQLQKAVREILGRLQRTLGQVASFGGQAADLLGATHPANVQSAQGLLAAGKTVLASPEPPARLTEGSLWDSLPPEMTALVVRIKGYMDGLQWAKDRYAAESLRAVDWRGILERCEKYWAGIGRILRPAFWSDRKTVKSAQLPPYRPRFAELVADLRQLAKLQVLRDELDAAADLGARYFDRLWSGASSNWAEVARLTNWIRPYRKAVQSGQIGPPGVKLSGEGQDRSALARAIQSLEQSLEAWQRDEAALTQAVSLREPEAFQVPVEATPLQDVQARLTAMLVGLESLFEWAQYQEVLQTCEQGPLAGFVQQARTQAVEPELLPLAMEKQYLHLVVEDILVQREVLRQFNGANHEADRLRFADLDRRWVEQTGCRLQAKLAAERPPLNRQAAGSSPVGILLAEMNRRRGGKRIRRLVREAGEAIQRLSPCFMMSPLSVAQFIDPAGIRFDVVVFDEASQVEPADALGAIARGGQLILVGDPQQLPPTNFFNTMAGGPEEQPEEGAAQLVDMESILDRGLSVLPKVRLRWHYRSRHESLIAFSNAEFYENDLVVFPSCHADREELGLKILYDPADAYDRGGSQTNRQQAQRIARFVFEHARRDPQKTLGVGAFSVRQQQAILDEIERLRRGDDSVEEFFDRSKAEPFFVKNLETIQGDERDVVLLSIGYGKARPDERLSMNFGPLNQDNGYRRLNVLITRARQRCLVFSSIGAEDFDLGATAARGVHALKGYLQYAQSGRLPEVSVAQGEFGSPFEEAVYNALTERSVQLHRQVGCAGYAIDLAVIDPDQPGRYLLGIECDGATYHASATARDRDRLRQQVLEDLGWRVCRIWSTEWFRTPQREIERVLETIARAKAGQLGPAVAHAAPQPPIRPSGTAGTTDRGTSAEANGQIVVPEYQCFVPSRIRSAERFYTDSTEVLAEVVEGVVRSEGPVHVEQVFRRAVLAWNLSRTGSTIRGRLEKAVALAVRRGGIRAKDGFLWLADMEQPPVRRREDEEIRDIDLICREEIGQAARMILMAQLGMIRTDLVVQTARLLGFRNTGQRVSARIDEAIQGEIDAGQIIPNGNGQLKSGT